MNKGGEIESFAGLSFTSRFLAWWYGEAVKRMFVYFKALYVLIFDFFSVELCLRTFFAPWKRDVIAPAPGTMLEVRFRIFVLNLVARLIGIIIKSGTLFMYSLSFIALTAVEIILFFLWIFAPLIIFAIFVFALYQIFLFYE